MALAKISLLILCVFAELAFSGFKDPNLATNLLCSLTNCSFVTLYLVTKTQFVKEQNKFVAKFGSLNTEKAKFAKSQRINKEILANATNN